MNNNAWKYCVKHQKPDSSCMEKNTKIHASKVYRVSLWQLFVWVSVMTKQTTKLVSYLNGMKIHIIVNIITNNQPISKLWKYRQIRCQFWSIFINCRSSFHSYILSNWNQKCLSADPLKSEVAYLIYGINKSYVQCNLNKNILPFCNINISELVTAMGFHKAHMISM